MDSVKRLYGVYRGVVKNNNDPQNQRRLKLQVQTTGSEVTDWAWPMEPSSIHTEVPIVGQGVWVTYVGGDPEYPVWSGSFGKNQGANKQMFVKPLSDSVSITSVQDVIIINDQSDGTKELDLTDSLIAIANKEASLQTTLVNLQSTVASIVQGTGIQGTQGTAGALGTQGAQGYLGTQGTTGTGTQGTQGFTGVQGTVGSQGTTGAGTQGTQGTQGANGTQGVQGTQGVIGSTGVQGAQGTQGAQGAQGAQGTIGAQGIVGAQGTEGTQGTLGTQGATGAGLQGVQGTTGTQGTLGTQGATGAGLQGVQGTTGTQGIISSASEPTIQNVLWLDTTAAAESGPQGTNGAQGIQGTTGSQGTHGVQGTQGVQGTAGTSASDLNAWTSYTPTWTSDSSTPSIGNGSLTGRYKQIGKTVFFSLKLTYGSTTTGGAGAWMFGLPVTAYDANYQFAVSILNSGLAWYGAIANGNYKNSTSHFSIIHQNDTATTVWGGVTAGAPFTFGAQDTLTVSGSYEAV